MHQLASTNHTALLDSYLSGVPRFLNEHVNNGCQDPYGSIGTVQQGHAAPYAHSIDNESDCLKQACLPELGTGTSLRVVW